MQKRCSGIVRGEGKENPQAQKKSWGARHPLLGGIMMAAAVGFVAFSVEKNWERRYAENERPTLANNSEAAMREAKKERLKNQIGKIRAKLEFQKMLIRSGWEEKMQALRASERKAEDADFTEGLEGKTKEELLKILTECRKEIESLRAELRMDGMDSEEINGELAAAERREAFVQDRLNEMEIEEMGLLEKSAEELEVLLAELDAIIAHEEGFIAGFDEYIDAMEQRILVVKALEEKKFWGEILPNV